MRIKLIEDLPMASSAELYQLSWVIEQLLADPRRIVQARAQLHTGQQVQYLHWDDGKMRSARVVAMKDRRVTVFDEASRSQFTLPLRGDHDDAVQRHRHRCSCIGSCQAHTAARDRQPRRLPRRPPRELHRPEPAAPRRADRAHRTITRCPGCSALRNAEVAQRAASMSGWSGGGRSGLSALRCLLTLQASRSQLTSSCARNPH